MKKVCVLVDFTEASRLAIGYACQFAHDAKAVLQILHVSKKDNQRTIETVKADLKAFIEEGETCEVDYEVIVEEGDFMAQIPELLRNHHSELVIIATHGVKGIFHTMQGPEVLKLIQKINIPSLVLQNQTPRDFKGYKNILFPIAPHSNFQIKIDQTAKIARVYNSKVIVYILTPDKGELDKSLADNLARVEMTFNQQGIAYEKVYEPSKVYGIGYARQALEYVEHSDIDLLSIMAHASEEHSYFGNVERSEFILNKKGVPVLCCTE